MSGIESARPLGIGHVVHSLGKQGRQVELVAQRWAVEMILLQPAQLFAMWAIGQHAHHIAPLRPTHQRVNAVEQVVRAGELANLRRRRMDRHARHGLNLSTAAALDLQISAAAVRELGHPCIDPMFFERQCPITPAAAGRVVDFPRRLDQFRGRDLDRRPSRTARVDPRHHRGVLAEVIDPQARLQFAYIHGVEDAEQPDRRRGEEMPFS